MFKNLSEFEQLGKAKIFEYLESVLHPDVYRGLELSLIQTSVLGNYFSAKYTIENDHSTTIVIDYNTATTDYFINFEKKFKN